MQLKSWLDLEILLVDGCLSCWLASLNEQDFQKVHCELWVESRKIAMHLVVLWNHRQETLPRMSTGKASNEIVVSNVGLYPGTGFNLLRYQ